MQKESGEHINRESGAIITNNSVLFESGDQIIFHPQIILKEEVLPVDKLSTMVDGNTNILVNSIVKEDDPEKLKDLTKLFQANQSKKNIIQVVKYSELLDKVNDQALERLTKAPGQIADNDLINYMKVARDNINNSQDYIENFQNKPSLQINQQNISVNINSGKKEEDSLSKESRDHVIDAVTSILDNIKKENTNVIDADVVETAKINDKEKGENIDE